MIMPYMVKLTGHGRIGFGANKLLDQTCAARRASDPQVATILLCLIFTLTVLY